MQQRIVLAFFLMENGTQRVGLLEGFLANSMWYDSLFTGSNLTQVGAEAEFRQGTAQHWQIQFDDGSLVLGQLGIGGEARLPVSDIVLTAWMVETSGSGNCFMSLGTLELFSTVTGGTRSLGGWAMLAGQLPPLPSDAWFSGGGVGKVRQVSLVVSDAPFAGFPAWAPPDENDC